MNLKYTKTSLVDIMFQIYLLVLFFQLSMIVYYSGIGVEASALVEPPILQESEMEQLLNIAASIQSTVYPLLRTLTQFGSV